MIWQNSDSGDEQPERVYSRPLPPRERTYTITVPDGSTFEEVKAVALDHYAMRILKGLAYRHFDVRRN